MTREEKNNMINSIKSELDNSSNIYLTDCSGLNAFNPEQSVKYILELLSSSDLIELIILFFSSLVILYNVCVHFNSWTHCTRH